MGIGEKPQILSFQHLYDNVFAAFEKATDKWSKPRIIMPKGFTPEIGQKYECRVTETMYGVFTYNGQDYRLCIAELETAASIIDLIGQERQQETINPLAAKLAAIDIKSLPAKHEIVTLTVQVDRKHGGFQFAPQYRDEDPAVGGKPSMRFFHPVRNGFKMSPGQEFQARVCNTRPTRSITRKGAVIINVEVEII